MILLYDGDCGFCSRGVLFVHARDARGVFRFASLQSAVGRELMRQHGVPDEHRESVVLIDEERAHLASDAVLLAAPGLRWPWRWAYAFIVLPRGMRDAAYRLVARHRHKFGPAVVACRQPSPELRAKMLD